MIFFYLKKIKLKKYTILFLSIFTLSACGKETYSNCILENTKNLQTESAIAAVKLACLEKTTPSEKNEKIDKPITELSNNICYVYWDGRRFSLGATEGKKFKRYSSAYRGIEALVISLPLEMVIDLGIQNDETLSWSDGKFGELMKNNWANIREICDLPGN